MLIIRPLTYNDQQWTCMHDRRTLYLAISLKVLESFFFFEWSVFPKCNILCKTLINQFLSNYDSCVLSTGRTVQWLRTKTKIHFYSFSLFIITVVMLYETVRQLLINKYPIQIRGEKGRRDPALTLVIDVLFSLSIRSSRVTSSAVSFFRFSPPFRFLSACTSPLVNTRDSLSPQSEWIKTLI